MADSTASQQQDIQSLFACLAEQIKLPLTQVANAAELINEADPNAIAANKQSILEISRAAMRLIDGFLLNVSLQEQSKLDLEPVPLSSLLYDTAQVLDPYAKLHGCELELDIRGKYVPVMGNFEVLKSALVNLGYSFINSTKQPGRSTLTLALRRTSSGINAGIFSDSSQVSSKLLSRAKQFRGLAHQPLPEFAGDSAAGVFVADSLVEHLGSSIKVSKLNGMSGLSATLMPSRQLSLV